VATLKANFFVGVNLGHNIFKVGFLCLIGIAHLPETLSKLKFYRSFEMRPCLSTNLAPSIQEELLKLPGQAEAIIQNLMSAVKQLNQKIIDRLPISGNIEYEDDDGGEEKDTPGGFIGTELDLEV